MKCRQSVILVSLIVVAFTAETGSAYYSTGLGRFITRDPIGYEGSKWNLYEYLGGMPLVFVDPSGLIPIDVPPWPPGGGPIGPAPPPPKTCCCCCAEDIQITHNDKFKPRGNGAGHFGHDFQVLATLSYKKGNVGTDCTLHWMEKVNRLGRPEFPVDKWYDAADLMPNSLVFGNWNHRRKPCGSSEPVYFNDSPSIHTHSAPGPARVLEFYIMVFSGEDCPCLKHAVMIRGIQTLETNGNGGIVQHDLTFDPPEWL